MLYTRKGDTRTTKMLRGDGHISKDSLPTEALGTVDELNSYLGLCKVHSKRDVVAGDDVESIAQTIEVVQKTCLLYKQSLRVLTY